MRTTPIAALTIIILSSGCLPRLQADYIASTTFGTTQRGLNPFESAVSNFVFDTGMGTVSHIQESAATGIGQLKAYASYDIGTLPGAGGPSFVLHPVAEAQFGGPTVIISPIIPGAPVPANILVALNLQVGGSMVARTGHAADQARATASVTLNGGIAGQPFFGSITESLNSTNQQVTVLYGGVFSNLGTSGVFDTIDLVVSPAGPVFSPQFMVPVNTPFPIGLDLLASAKIDSVLAAPGSPTDTYVNSDFSHTVTLPLSGPVFDLPDGYTANSPDLGIVNNLFIGAQSEVPEPSSLLSMGSAVICLLALNYRKRRSKHAR